jgi:hypothetical protein
MAIVQNPIVGRSSGKFANAIFSKNYQKNIIRSKPIEVANPNTTGQQTQRHKFTIFQSFVSDLLTIFRIGYTNKSMKKSAYSKAMAYMFASEVLGTIGTPSITTSVIDLSESKKHFMNNIVATPSSGSELNFTAEPTPDEIKEWLENEAENNDEGRYIGGIYMNADATKWAPFIIPFSFTIGSDALVMDTSIIGSGHVNVMFFLYDANHINSSSYMSKTYSILDITPIH